MALTIDEINAVTSEAFLDKVCTENAYNSSVFWMKKLKDGFVKHEGGVAWERALRYKKLGQGASTNPRAQMTFESTSTRTAASYTPAYYEDVQMIFWDERVKNTGKAQIVDLIADRVEELRQDMTDTLCTALFSTSTPGSYDLTPLPYIIDTGNTIGGIAVADAANWAAAAEDTTTTQLNLFGSGSLAYMVNTATHGTHKPTLHLTTPDLYSKFMSIAVGTQYYRDEETAKMGFNNLVFIDAPVVGDKYVTSAMWLGIDMDSFDIRVPSSSEKGIEVTDWLDLTPSGYINTAGKFATFVGQVCPKRRWTSFKYTALDYTL